jgi:flagellar biosynthesis chaperone FliJ
LQQDNADLARERNLAQQLANKRAHELNHCQSQVNELEKKVAALSGEKLQLMKDLKSEQE